MCNHLVVGQAVTQSNTLDSINQHTWRILIQYEIEVFRNELLSSGASIDWELPFSIDPDGMVGSDTQSLMEVDHLNDFVHFCDQNTLYFRSLAIGCSDEVSFSDVADQLGSSIGHRGGTVASDTSSAVVVVSTHICRSNIVLLLHGWLRRRQLQENSIDVVLEFLEK